MFILLPFLFQSDLSKQKVDQNINLASLPSFGWNHTVFINNGTDEGRDLVLDPSGNVFVTGKIYNSSKNASDVILLKYNSDGDVEWNKTWGGSSDDEGHSIDIDSSNNLYIAGWTKSFGVNGTHDVCLLKFNSNGILAWNKTWGNNETDTGIGIVVSSNSVYVVGFTKINNRSDAVILKYDTSGNLEWERTWGESQVDCAYDVGVDSSGDIYVTGYTESFGAIVRDLFLAKYASNGTSLFNTTWGDDRFSDSSSLVVSSDGVYVVGNIFTIGLGGNDILLSKFTLDTGYQLWNTTWGGNNHEYGYDIALDSNGDIHVIGSLESLDKTLKEIRIVRFNNSGEFERYTAYSNGIEDEGFGIIIDSVDCEYFTGKTKLEDTDYDIFLYKKSPFPEDFVLSSNASSLDADGTFNLSWTEAIDADNYSIYQSDEIITEINGSVNELELGNTNRIYLVENLVEGPYYFMVVAFNKYGNTSSNNIHITVQFPPGSFTIDQPSPAINSDGIITLSWSTSLRTDNYSIYRSNLSISDYKVSGHLLYEGLENNSCTIAEEVEDGTHFFIMVALNEVGEYSSNCISIMVKKLPGSFTLSTEVPAGTDDDDGIFFLSWTESKFADYYTIYSSSTPMNESGAIIEEFANYSIDFYDPEYRYQINVSENGMHYYELVSYNANGNVSGGYVSVNVQIYIPPFIPDIPEEIIIIVVVVAVIGIACVISYQYIRKRRGDKAEPTYE
jgi:hypothetical protein